MDGDTITISTHHELTEAFEQFVTHPSYTDVTPIVLRVQALFTKHQKGGANKEIPRKRDEWGMGNVKVAAVKISVPLESTCTGISDLSFAEHLDSIDCYEMVPSPPKKKVKCPDNINHYEMVPRLPKKKVQVFIMMGQSNMLGMGSFGPVDKENTLENAVIRQGKYHYLWDNRMNDWAIRKTLRNVFVNGNGSQGFRCLNNSWMAGNKGHLGNKIGPELGIGHHLRAHYKSAPVMMLKSCTGNRALGWDLLPPGIPSFDWADPNTGEEYTYAGYGQSPERWLKGTTPQPIGWKAGCQYDGDTLRIDEVLSDLGTFYPGASELGYEVAGIFWWQGDRDASSPALSEHYENNLVALIKALRKRYNAPSAPFITASLGQSTLDPSCNGNCGRLILQAMLNVADATKYPEFEGNVAMVNAHDYALPGESSGGHYNKNANTYMKVGQAMGKKMAQLLKE